MMPHPPVLGSTGAHQATSCAVWIAPLSYRDGKGPLHVTASDARRRKDERARLNPGGLVISGDCYLAGEPRLAAEQRETWLRHLERTYTRQEAEDYLQAWSGEDTYFALGSELDWLRATGFVADVIWREDGFAVAGFRPAWSGQG